MKIAWATALWAWASLSGDATAQQQLRFATGESLDEILEDETHRLKAVELKTSAGLPLSDAAATWSKTYFQLLISCAHGKLQLDQDMETQLVDTTFLCASDPEPSRSIGVLTTAQEAQQVLNSIIYQPDVDYHRTWSGVTDSLCVAGATGYEIVRMQLTPVSGDVPQPAEDACVAVDLDVYSEAGSTHEKKISVTSVNDPPTVEREPGKPLSVLAGGSCVGLFGFKLGDAEAAAFQGDLVPILTLQLSVEAGALRLNRRLALKSGIHAVGSDNNSEDETPAWQFPDLADSSLTMKGAISDLNEFLSAVEYCSPLDRSTTASDTLRATLSDNGFCGSVSKESLSGSLSVPVSIVPAVDLGEVLFTKTNITVAKHSAPVPLQYTFETTTEVKCTLELKYDDGMLLGIDYHTNTIYKTPTRQSSVADAARVPPDVLVPTRGLIVQFWGDKSKGESTTFKFARNVCALDEVCHQVESTALFEGSRDEEIIAAAQTLALADEGVTDLQVIRYSVSRFWLIWNVPVTFVHDIVVSTPSRVSIQTAERRFSLQGSSEVIAAQLKTLNIYSLMGGIWSYNRLNVTLSSLDRGTSVTQDEVSAQLDVFATPALENIELLVPVELDFSEHSEMSLGTMVLAYPPTYTTSTALRWTIRSTHGTIWWDPSSVSPAVVSRHISKNEMELRGNLVDLNAALSRIRIDESNVQDVQQSFATFYEEQTYELIATVLSETISVQTLTTTSVDGSVVGSIVLGVDLPARNYADLDLEISSGHCQSVAIGVDDDVSTISRKITRMECDAISTKVSERVRRSEVQSIRVFALYPARVDELAGTFRVWCREQFTDDIPIDASIATIKASLLKVVLDVNGIEVSREELPGENGFEWQITFGTEGEVGKIFQIVYDDTSVPFKLSTALIQHGRSANDLRLDTFYPGVSLSVRRIRSADSGTLALECSFLCTFDDLPTLSVRASTLASAQTAQVLGVTARASKTTVISGEADFFQLMVQNHVTTPLDAFASASTIEKAIRDLPIDRLRVLVERKASAFVSGRFDYTVVMSAPSAVALDLVAASTAPLSRAIFRASLVHPGSEALIAIDTISTFLETLDNDASVASGEIRAWIPRMTRKLGIRLPVSYLQVELNQTLLIDDISFEGYAHELNFTISCTKGSISLLPKQHLQSSLGGAVDLKSKLGISGLFSTLEQVLESNHLIYSPKVGVSGSDKLIFRIESGDDQASQIIAVMINAATSPPSLTLPVTPISVIEEEIVSITEVAVNVDEQGRTFRGISVKITTQSGSVELATEDSAQHTAEIQIQGDAENINAVLKGLRYRASARAATADDQILISTSWVAESGGQISPVTFVIPIKITSRPLSVRILLDGSIMGDTSLLTTTMGTPALFTDLLIQVKGGDGQWSHCSEAAAKTVACNTTVELSFFAGHGLVSNLTEGREEGSLLPLKNLIGSIGQANRFLLQQAYVPDAKFYGPDQVVITIKHATSTTDEKGVMVEETMLLPVLVSPACEAPQLSWTNSGTDTMSFSSSTRARFLLPDILLTREGLEERHCRDNIVFRVTVKANQGFLALESSAVAAKTFDDHRALVFEGRIWDLNLALQAVGFQFEIYRGSQRPITASIDIRVEANAGQEGVLAGPMCSALLRLKFVGDTRPPAMLARDTILASEDTDMLIGGALNVDTFVDFAADATVDISVSNGVVYAAADGVHMAASSEQRISTNDIRHVRSVMSNLRYIPSLDFNGIDEIDFTMQNLKSILYIYVQAENDPPSIEVNSDEAKNWYKYPSMFLPSFQLNDPDESDLLQVDIHIDNGSLFLDQMLTRTFDGVTLELNSSSSLRLTSRLGRLNTIFLQRLVEVVPDNCLNNSTARISCSASVKLCVDDGAASACQELRLPEQDLFYRVAVSNWAKNLNVSAGSSLNISEAFKIHQRFDALHDLFLHVRASYGFVRMDIPICGELRNTIGVNDPERPGLANIIHASDATCLNKALASMQLQSTHRANSTIVVQLELFCEKMRLLANESMSVNVIDNMLPERVSAVRTSDEPWLTTLGSYANLPSLVTATIAGRAGSSTDDSDDDIPLELNISCSSCLWTYQAFVPRVSYEFAQIPSSQLHFRGLSQSLNAVFATLELSIALNNSASAEAIDFQLAPAVPRSSLDMDGIWRDSTHISIPFTLQPAAPIDVEAEEGTFSDAALDELDSRSSPQLPETTLILRNASVTIQVKEGNVHVLGDILTVNGDRDDPRWLRMEARVTQGRLHIPTNVCCVEIRGTEHENELDVVGPALALKNALAAAEFESREPFSGEDLLELTFAPFASFSQAAASFSIPIDIIAINHAPTIRHRRPSSGNPFSEEEIVLDDIDLVGLEALATPFRVSLSSVDGIFFLDDKAKRRVSVLETRESGSGYTNFTFEASLPVANALLARVIYAADNADVKCADTNELFVVVNDHGHGIDTWIPKQAFTTLVMPGCETHLQVPSEEEVVVEQTAGREFLDSTDLEVQQVRLLPPPHQQLITKISVPPGGSSSISGSLVIFSGKVDFQVQADSSSGQEFYVSDGSAASTVLLVDLIPGPFNSAPTSISIEGPITIADQTAKTQGLSFTAFDSAGHETIWISVGKKQGTTPLLDDIFLLSHNLTFPSSDTRARQFLEFGNAIYFVTHGLSAGRARVQTPKSPSYQVDIVVNYGAISIVSTETAKQRSRKNATRQLTLNGSATNLERALNRLVYLPPQNWNEEHLPGGHIVEWYFMVSSENKSVESFADLVILPRVDALVISVPEALEDTSHYMSGYHSALRLECLPLVCEEDTSRVLDGFSVKSADTTRGQLLIMDLLVLTISISHGIISFGDTLHANCINQFVGIQSWKRVSFKATADCINRVLAAMVYVGEPNFSGTDKLKIRVEYAHELGASVDEVTVPVVVVELNDAPYIEKTSVYYEAEEDVPLLIEDLRLRDPDAVDELHRVTMETNYGRLALLRSNGVNVATDTAKSTAEEFSRLTLEGTLRNLDAALASVIYTSAKDWNSLQYRPDGGMNGFDTITIHSTDFSSFNGSSTSVLFVYVDPQPDSVVIDIPSNAETSIYADGPLGTLRGDEDTWININGLSFSSADVTSHARLVVSLSVEHGILSLSQLRGITFREGNADRSKIVKIMGTFASVNACVVGLSYHPNKDFYGRDSFVVMANAIDEYTQQETPKTFIDVAITINPVNDPPVWNIGSSTVREIHQGRAASVAGISFHDVDVAALNCAAESCVMDLIVEASHGIVTLSDQLPSLFSNDVATKKVTYVVLSATPDELNAMLSEMIFELADPGYYRADSPDRTDIKLRLTVDDRGTFGRGGPQISTTTVVFSPVVWSRYDISILAPEDVLTLDEDTVFVFDGDLQLFDPDSARPFYNLLEFTISCGKGEFALSSRVAGVQVVQNDSYGVIVVRGFFAQLNAALNGSAYIPAANWYGSEQLSFSVVELNSLAKSRETVVASVFLFVAPVCDEPSWTSQGAEPLKMKEDGYLLINTMSLTNPDLDDEQREVEVTIGVKHGGVMLSMTRGLLIRQTAYSTYEDRLSTQNIPPGQSFAIPRLFFKYLAFRGRVSDINAALKGMVFKPWLNYNSDGWPVDEIALAATSSCGSSNSKSSSGVSHVTISIAVDAVNDPPVLLSQHFQPISPSYSLHSLKVLTRHTSIEAVEDLSQRLELTELYDADYDLRGGDLRLLVNISCIHCTITSKLLSQPSEFQPSDDLIVVARNWKNDEGVQLLVHGNLPSLNTGLMNQLFFRGTDNFNGLAFVLIDVSDLGNYGEGGEQRSAFVLGVRVRAASDIPQIYLPQYQSLEPALQLDEGASVLIHGAPALSTVLTPDRRQASEWSVMNVNLLASDSSTRIRSLHVFSGSEGFVASFVVPYSEGFLFSGYDADFGQELWRSDGTAVGTVLLKDIFPGSEGSRPSYLTPFSKDNRVYFSAKGPHLSWLVKEDYQDTCQSFRQSSFDANVVFTVATHNIWDPDETYDCPLGFRWMSTSEAHRIFVGTMALEGHSEEPLTYFDQCGWRGYEWGGRTRKYFRFSDSKTTGAFKHAGFRDSYRVDTGLQIDLFAGIVCYRESPAYQVTWGAQLWATDGTAEGTQRIARISTAPEGSTPSHFVELDKRLYFQASSTEFGSELWSTDGTRIGTYLVADVEFGSRSAEPRFLIAFDARVFFSAATEIYGREVWFSDGDPRFQFADDQHASVGTSLLLDICAGEKSSSPQHFTVLSPTTGSLMLLFQADDCVHGPELWLTDGTRAGTVLILDINKGPAGSHPTYLAPFAGQVYFQADDGVHGSELWTTDGTSTGTTMLVDIAPGVLGSTPSFFTVLDNVNAPSGVLVFAAQAERDRLTEFWRSDGTSVGTTKLFPQSREVVELNTDSLNLQLAGHKLVSISSQSEAFFCLGQKRGQGIDFQDEAVDRLRVAQAEDVAHTRSITLKDVETLQKERELTLSLNCSKGWLSLGRQCDSVAISVDGAAPDPKQAAALTLKGSLDALNCAVEKVTYHSKPQENGWDEIHVTLSQGVVPVSGEVNGATNVDDSGSYTVSKRMLVEIRAVNDPPSITIPSVFYAPMSAFVALEGIEITDPDSNEGILYVSITVRSGRLRVTLPHSGIGGGPTALDTGGDKDSSQKLEFAATVEQAKAIFGALEYTCDDRYGCSNSQRDYLTVQVDDNGFTGARGPQVTAKTAEIVVVGTGEI